MTPGDGPLWDGVIEDAPLLALYDLVAWGLEPSAAGNNPADRGRCRDGARAALDVLYTRAREAPGALPAPPRPPRGVKAPITTWRRVAEILGVGRNTLARHRHVVREAAGLGPRDYVRASFPDAAAVWAWWYSTPTHKVPQRRPRSSGVRRTRGPAAPGRK